LPQRCNPGFSTENDWQTRISCLSLLKKIPNCFDAMTTSPVESMNCYIKHRSKASALNGTSQSLMLITEGTDSRIAGIDNSGNVIFIVCVST
jgi:hypothetical protein